MPSKAKKIASLKSTLAGKDYHSEFIGGVS